MKVFKYPLSLCDDQVINMPEGAELLQVGVDPGGHYCIWARVDPFVPSSPKRILMRGTGHVIGDEPYFGSIFDGSFVWHVFEG